MENCKTISFPGRFVIRTGEQRKVAELERELDSMARILVEGCRAISGLYMRMCDVIRDGPFTDDDVRRILGQHFPPSRVSEILRVARAPERVYQKYAAGFFGFKAALRATRFYQITPSQELKRRKLRRAAERIVSLTDGPVEFTIRDRVISVRSIYTAG